MYGNNDVIIITLMVLLIITLMIVMTMTMRMSSNKITARISRSTSILKQDPVKEAQERLKFF
jgi:flagellar basal body-associated protein FliL